MSRIDFLLRGIDKKTMRGVELGAWTNPIAPKSAGWNTTTVDFSDTADLRSIAENHSSPQMRVLANKIETVDFVWRGNKLDKLLLIDHPDGFDYVIASHVFEHIPDLIGLFGQLARIIRPRGVISLALPDKRLCFDIFRPISLTHDLLAAHDEHRTRHSPETLFASYAYQALDGGMGAWPRSRMPDIRAVRQLRKAYSSYLDEKRQAKADRPYIDAHAWVMVPASFELVILELNVLGLIDFRIRGQIEEGENSEFLVQLELGKIELDDKAIEARRAELLMLMIGPQSPGCTAHDHPEIRLLRDEVAEVRSYALALDKEVLAIQKVSENRQDTIDYLENQHVEDTRLITALEQEITLRIGLQQNLDNNAKYYQQEILRHLSERDALIEDSASLRDYIADIESRYHDLYVVAEERHNTIIKLAADLNQKAKVSPLN